MLSITNIHRCYLYRGRTDMRKGIDTLSGLVRNEFGKDPLSGELFIFFNSSRSLVKILMWDQDGFGLYQKRLEGGTFEIPDGNLAHEAITAQQLNLILAGVSLKNVRLRPRYQHTINNASAA